MRNILKIILCITIIALSGCDEYRSKAVVADYVTGSKYEVVKVDGGPVERIQHGVVVTRVPFVILEQGNHSLTLNEWQGNTKNQLVKTLEIDVTVKKGHRYKLVENNGQAILIEDLN